MKFINYLETITGVGIYPLISLCVFFAFFIVMSVWVLRADKGFIRTMKYMPFPEHENE